jgi:hypothetical protein
MRRNVFLAAILAAVLAMTVATGALAQDQAEQDVSVWIGTTGMLSIDVSSVHFYELLPPVIAREPFEVMIYDSTVLPWEVTVVGPELARWGDVCVEWGEDEYGDPSCMWWEWGRLDETLAASNLELRAAAIDHDRVTGYNTTVHEETPATLLRAAARTASGPTSLWFSSPPSARLTVPEGTSGGYYQTTFTYTIMNTAE